jgi:hypothetical protein
MLKCRDHDEIVVGPITKMILIHHSPEQGTESYSIKLLICYGNVIVSELAWGFNSGFAANLNLIKQYVSGSVAHPLAVREHINPTTRH